MQIDFEKVNKPLEKKPLRRSLAECPELYERIKDCCVLFASGIDGRQRKEAAAELLSYFPPGKDALLNCKYHKDTKKLLLTTRTSDRWHYVASIPTSTRAYKMLGKVYLISMN